MARAEKSKHQEIGTTIMDQRWRLAARDLKAAFEAEPVEDGLKHPGEGILGTVLSEHPKEGAVWICSLIVEAGNPAFASDVLRCLGRLKAPATLEWRKSLIRSALNDRDPEVRDAAIQAVENWGDSGLLSELETHAEPLDWLRIYLERVVTDLREET